MKQLFLSLSALPGRPSMHSLGAGYDPSYARGSSVGSSVPRMEQGILGRTSQVLGNLILLCSCLACCYAVEKCRKSADGPQMSMYVSQLHRAA